MSELRVRGEPLAGRSVLVMGLGLYGGGLAAARAALRCGARVTVTDLRDAEALAESVAALAEDAPRMVLGEHRAEDFEAADVVIVNPAVRPDHPLLARARERGAQVTSELELLLEACPARVVMITGTQGKSSTCSALATLLAESGHAVRLGGNIGRSLLPELPAMRADELCVIETSSYQLEALPETALVRRWLTRRVAAVAVTNVLADHLDRHGSLAAYAAAKRRLLELAGPGVPVVLSADDERTAAWARETDGAVSFSIGATADFVLDDEGHFRAGAEVLGDARDLRLAGEFQRANVLCALAVARSLGASAERLAAALPELRGLDHRMQDLGSVAGHRVWDNGISTTPDSTLAALRAVTGPLVWLCGGRTKDLPLEEVAREAVARCARAVTFGEAADVLAERLAARGLAVRAETTLAAGVRAAFAELRPGEELLFSPACSSFDEFRNVIDRARAFRRELDRAAAARHAPQARMR